MSDYEMVFIISPELDDEEISKTLDKLNELIAKMGGSVTEINQWGRRKLAYPVQKFMEGYYVLAQLKLEPASIVKFEASIHRFEGIIRHLLIRLNG